MKDKKLANEIFQIMKNSIFVWFYNHGKVKSNEMLVQLGNSYSELYSFYEVLNDTSIDTRIYIACSSLKRKSKKEIEKNIHKNLIWLKIGSIKYYRILTQAKSLVNFDSFETVWVKKSEQVYYKIVYFKNSVKKLQNQTDCLQVDYFLCLNNETVKELKRIELFKKYSKAKIFNLKEGKIVERQMETFAYNGKKNIAIYGAALEQNGLTSSLISMLKNVDGSKSNYLLCVKNTDNLVTVKEKGMPLSMLELKILTIHYTFSEIVAEICYYKMNLSWKIWKTKLDDLYEREYKRNFADIKIDTMLQFTGYESDMIHLFSMGNGKHIIYVHSDMEREITMRKAQHRKTLEEMYRKYDLVAVVNEELLDVTKNIGGSDTTYKVANNFFDETDIIEKSKKKMEFQAITECNHLQKEVEQILQRSEEKFITIGRFSQEKGHFMLLDAFSQYLQDGKTAYLFIIGGRGPLYQKTVSYAKKLGIEEKVVLIKSLDNPIAILKQCSLFMLPSFYEGFGLVILEAATVDVPVICTNVTGPAGFVKDHGGLVVECSKEGLYRGMKLYETGKVEPMKIDFNQYRNVCKNQLNAILHEEEMT